MTSDASRASPIAAVSLAALSGSIAGVLLAGRERFAPAPPLGGPDAVRTWADASAPLDLLAGATRSAVVVLSCYLLAVSLLALWSWFRPSAAVERALRCLTPRLLGVVLVGSVTLTTHPAAAEPIPSPRIDVVMADDVSIEDMWMEQLGDGEATQDRTTLPWAAAGRPAPDPDVSGRGPDDAATQPANADADRGEPYRLHVVQPGDHFWSIAERELHAAASNGQRTPPLATYWARMVELNRDRLVDSDDPDLIHPGQELLLPPISEGAPRRWGDAG